MTQVESEIQSKAAFGDKMADYAEGKDLADPQAGTNAQMTMAQFRNACRPV
jgi:hypothetical protein